MIEKKIRVGMCFSAVFAGNAPLAHIGEKLPVYLRLLEFCQQKGWQAYVLTRRTYQGNGLFNGVWAYSGGKFKQVFEPVKIDLVYDRSAGVKFPPENDDSVIWVNRRDFKILAWDKWAAYQKIGEYMPKTFWLESEKDIEKSATLAGTDWVVIKPFSGLKGLGIFIGPKARALNFKFDKKYKHYILQEFLDTSGGIPGITAGLHDLRVAIVNGRAVWCHVRVPPAGSFKANAAQGGNLTEVDYDRVPAAVKDIVSKVSREFSQKYDNPVYSLDFGLENGKPYIFEINDQIGFPKWEMKNRDVFLTELVANFEAKLAA